MTWKRPDHADAVLDAAVALARFAASSPALDGRPTVRTEVLRLYVLNLVTQGTLPGKGKTRYVSSGAAAVSRGDKLEHEHVYTRAFLTKLILSNPYEDSVRWILSNLAFAATVTHEEHTRLSRVKPPIEGWDRYVAAGVQVTDLVTGDPMADNVATPDWIRLPNQPTADTSVLMPVDAVGQLLATPEIIDLLNPDRAVPGPTDWIMRRAEAFECIKIVAAAAGHRFRSAADARDGMFAHSAGGGFGIRAYLVDAVMALFVDADPRS